MQTSRSSQGSVKATCRPHKPTLRVRLSALLSLTGGIHGFDRRKSPTGRRRERSSILRCSICGSSYPQKYVVIPGGLACAAVREFSGLWRSGRRTSFSYWRRKRPAQRRRRCWIRSLQVRFLPVPSLLSFLGTQYSSGGSYNYRRVATFLSELSIPTGR